MTYYCGLALMLVLSLPLAAVEPSPSGALFAVAAGSAMVDGQDAAIGSEVAIGSIVQSGASSLRLRIIGSNHGNVYLAPNSSLRGEELSDNGRWILRLVIGRGTVQVDADDLSGSGFDGMVVRGGVVEAEMTGTLFVVQRIRRDADYVALMRGGLRVRDTVAALDRKVNRVREILLSPNQGVTVDATIGIGEVESFNGPIMSKALSDSLAAVGPENDELIDADPITNPEGDPDEPSVNDQAGKIGENLAGGGLQSAKLGPDDNLVKSLGGIISPIGAGNLLNDLLILPGDLLLDGGLAPSALAPVLDDPPPPPPVR